MAKRPAQHAVEKHQHLRRGHHHGDGRVALILDVLGLAQRANVVSEVRDRAVTDKDGKQTLGAEVTQQKLVKPCSSSPYHFLRY